MWRVLRQIAGFAQNAGVDNFIGNRDQARPAASYWRVRMPEYTWAEYTWEPHAGEGLKSAMRVVAVGMMPPTSTPVENVVGTGMMTPPSTTSLVTGKVPEQAPVAVTAPETGKSPSELGVVDWVRATVTLVAVPATGRPLESNSLRTPV